MNNTPIEETTDLLASEAGAVIAITQLAAKEHNEIQVLIVGGRRVYSMPNHRKLDAFEALLPNPSRIRGEELVNDAESFLKLLKLYPDQPRRVRLSLSKILAVCTVNDHGQRSAIPEVPDTAMTATGIAANASWELVTNPGWSDHTIKWQLKKHRDLLAWQEIVGSPKSQIALMEFLEDHIVDITDKYNGPSQSVIEGVISELEVTTDAKFHAKHSLHDGNYVLTSDSSSKPSVEVPKRFDIGIPIFEGLDIAFRIGIRLRFRVNDGTLKFTLLFENIDAVMDEAWESASSKIIEGLPAEVPFLNVP